MAIRSRKRSRTLGQRGALVEVLAPLRPNRKDVEQIVALDDPEDRAPTVDLVREFEERAIRAVEVRLRPRLISRLECARGPQLYDVLHGASRTEIENTFGLHPGSLKTGDFATPNTERTRAVSRFVYETTGAVGIYSTSAKDDNDYMVSFFESGPNTGKLRVGNALTFVSTVRALDSSQLAAAIDYLGIPPAPHPAPSEPNAATSEATH